MLLHALHRGWTGTDIATAVGSGHWAGLAGLYRTKYGRRYADKALNADIDRGLARYSLLTDTQFAHDGVSDHADVAFHVVRVLAS